MPAYVLMLQSGSTLGATLQRHELGVADDARNEQWLTDQIFGYPGLLPADDFGDGFSPLIPLGREVQCGRNRIDALFVSPSGKLTLVETKLWKNPERHRAVIGQILEYAAELATWNVDRLVASVNEVHQHGEQTLEQVVRAHIKNSSGLDGFYHRLQTSLRVADFLLLIVGDRISASAESISSAVAGRPGLNFRFGLVEMQIFGDEDGPQIIVPRTVARSIEVERAVVRIEHVSAEVPRVIVAPGRGVQPPGSEATTAEDGDIATPRMKYRAPEDFLADPLLDPNFIDVYRNGMERWRNAGFSLSVNPRVLYWDAVVRGEPYNVSNSQATRFEIFVEKNWGEIGATQESRQRYVESVQTVPAAARAWATGKYRVAHDELTPAELDRLIDAALTLATDLSIQSFEK